MIKITKHHDANFLIHEDKVNGWVNFRKKSGYQFVSYQFVGYQFVGYQFVGCKFVGYQ